MTVAEQLRQRAHEYEVRAASEHEQHELEPGREHGTTALAWTTVAIVLHEVAGALDEEAA